MADAPDPAALADAASLLLRHRLFPRAMAWNVQRQSSPPSTEQLLEAAAQVLEQQQQQQSETQRRADALDVARSFPLLQASRTVQGPTPNQRQAQNWRLPETTPIHEENQREKLFRTMGKYLDTAEGYSAGFQPQRNYQNVGPRYSGMPSPERMTAEQQAAFQDMKISNYADEEQKSWTPNPLGVNRPPPSAVGVHQIRLRSPPRESVKSGSKRTRASNHVPAVKDDEIAPSLARALLTGCGAKQCSFEGCKKIAVSKGLCRGHGGGRRCQHSGCTKCAQSRSPFCWAHGGGKRCEAPNCRRSRKTKRFCVDHVDMELTVPLKSDSDSKTSSTKSSKSKSSTPTRKKTSGSYTSVDSDDSIGKQSTVSCDSSYSVAYRENQRMPANEYITIEQKYAQYHHQPAGEMSGNPPPSLQLPSLNEALLRTVPVQYATESRWVSTTTTTISSPPAPHSSQYKSEHHPSWPNNSE